MRRDVLMLAILLISGPAQAQQQIDREGAKELFSEQIQPNLEIIGMSELAFVCGWIDEVDANQVVLHEDQQIQALAMSTGQWGQSDSPDLIAIVKGTIADWRHRSTEERCRQMSEDHKHVAETQETLLSIARAY